MATFTITSLEDNAGDTSIGTLDPTTGAYTGTLRQAINFTNQNVKSPSTLASINVQSGLKGTITLAGNLPLVATSNDLDGSGLTLDAAGGIGLLNQFSQNLTKDGSVTGGGGGGKSGGTAQSRVVATGARRRFPLRVICLERERCSDTAPDLTKYVDSSLDRLRAARRIAEALQHDERLHRFAMKAVFVLEDCHESLVRAAGESLGPHSRWNRAAS